MTLLARCAVAAARTTFETAFQGDVSVSLGVPASRILLQNMCVLSFSPYASTNAKYIVLCITDPSSLLAACLRHRRAGSVVVEFAVLADSAGATVDAAAMAAALKGATIAGSAALSLSTTSSDGSTATADVAAPPPPPPLTTTTTTTTASATARGAAPWLVSLLLLPCLFAGF